MPKDETNCGGPSCRQFVDDVAERIAEPLSKQHTAGIAAIKELMTLHYQTLNANIAEIKSTADRQGNEMFTRLRRVESRQDVLEATTMTPEKVKDLVKPMVVSEERVKDIVGTDKGVQWARGQRGWVKAVWYAVSTAAILGALKIAFMIAQANSTLARIPTP